MRKITEIIIHCSATPEGKDFTVDDIRRWHLARKFADIGYHYVIYRDGSVHKGRAEKNAQGHTHATTEAGTSPTRAAASVRLSPCNCAWA